MCNEAHENWYSYVISNPQSMKNEEIKQTGLWENVFDMSEIANIKISI